MFHIPLRHVALGASALIIAGLAGCRHVPTDGSCANHDCGKTAVAKASEIPPTSPVAAPPTPPIVATPAPAPVRVPGTIAIKPVPIENLPPVASERLVPPPEKIEPLTPPPMNIVEKTKPEAAAPSNPTDITARAEFNHSSDYATLTGELSYSPLKNQWRLRYRSIAEEDRYGGSVTLDASTELKEFTSGQFVRVQGEVVDKDSRQTSPRYRVRNVMLVK